MTITTEINKAQMKVFRRAYIKRRDNTTALYESSWQDVSEYVEKWGTIQTTVDAVKLNDFRHSGISITFRNDEGKFNPSSNINSLWNGYMTRFKSLLKIEAGYEDTDGSDLPTNPSQGVFILTNDVPIDTVTNRAVFKFKSLVSVFENEPATNVAGLGSTQTASDLIAVIRDHTDGSGNLIFRQVISQSSWLIQTTTSNYIPDTGSSLDGLSCWEFMNKLAEAEGYIVFINRLGQLEFRDRDERTTTSQFSFYGQGFNNQNVIRLTEFNEPINKYYNYFRLKYLKPATSTSYVASGTNTVIDPSSTAWQYGVRTYEFENTFINNTATAQTIVDNLRSQNDVIKEEVKHIAKFTPQLEISDKVNFSYRSYDLVSQVLWDSFDWDEENWADESGEIFDWTDVEFKILSKRTNLDNFTTEFIMRRI